MTLSDEVGGDRSTAEPDSSSTEGDQSATAGDRRRASVDRSATDGGSSALEEDRSPVTVYRWACPICGESRTGMASGGENPRAKAEFSLRQHVETSDDDGHGPANAYPPEFDAETVGRAVSVD